MNASLESHNKLVKRYKQDFTMKNTREKIMKDLFHRSIDGSDPLVLESTLAERLSFRKKRGDLPEVVADMVEWDHPYNLYKLE